MPYLYAVQMQIPGYAFQPIKLGFSCQPGRRVKEFIHSPFPCLLLGHWPAPNGRADESDLHRKFKEHRLNGEWFYPAIELREFLLTKGVVAKSGASEGPPNEFDIYSLRFGEPFANHLRTVDRQWPRDGSSARWLKAEEASSITGLSAKEVSELIKPLDCGPFGKFYTLQSVTEFFLQHPDYVKAISYNRATKRGLFVSQRCV